MQYPGYSAAKKAHGILMRRPLSSTSSCTTHESNQVTRLRHSAVGVNPHKLSDCLGVHIFLRFSFYYCTFFSL